MDKNFSIRAILFWSEVCNKMNDTDFEIFNMEQNSKEDVDDFKNLLNTPSVKIISGILSFFLISFTNAFNILVLMFEKHGGDPLKRSLINQLTAEIGYSMIIHNTICIPLLTWRIFFGPLYVGIAALSTFCKNIAMLWIMNCLTEVFIVKALMLYKFSYMAGIDDTFMSRFLLLENLGFVFLSQASRFYLGSMYESIEFQILSGIMVKEEPIFWSIYGIIMLLIFGLAYGSITVKKIRETFKEYKLQKSLRVTGKKTYLSLYVKEIKLCYLSYSERFSAINGYENQEDDIAAPLRINNIKYNVPLLTGIHFVVLGAVSCILFSIGIILDFLKVYVYANMDDKLIPYQTFLYRKCFLESILFSLVLPILYLTTKRDVLWFMKNTIKRSVNLH